MKLKNGFVLIIFNICILLSLTGCADNSLNSEIQNGINNESTNQLQQSDISKLDDTKEIVYSVFEEEYKYGNQDVKIEIPTFNVNSDEIKELNDNIMQDYEDEIENNKSFVGSSITYEYYENGNIVSLVLENTMLEASRTKYEVDKKTRKVLDKEAILEYKNISKEKYENNILKQMSKEFEESYKQFEGEDLYEAQKQKNDSKENCSLKNTKVFIGKNGNLHYIANIYSLAGADKYEKQLDYGE